MLCYQVSLNGRRVCLAGVGDRGVLTGILTWVKRERQDGAEAAHSGVAVEELTVYVGGLANHDEDPVDLEWLRKGLRVGDEVTFKIVDSETCDPPIRSRTDLPEKVEEERRRCYEELKREYEGDPSGGGQ
jgi:hypothetical protein